jgi:hypothetical protein
MRAICPRGVRSLARVQHAPSPVGGVPPRSFFAALAAARATRAMGLGFSPGLQRRGYSGECFNRGYFRRALRSGPP